MCAFPVHRMAFVGWTSTSKLIPSVSFLCKASTTAVGTNMAWSIDGCTRDPFRIGRVRVCKRSCPASFLVSFATFRFVGWTLHRVSVSAASFRALILRCCVGLLFHGCVVFVGWIRPVSSVGHRFTFDLVFDLRRWVVSFLRAERPPSLFLPSTCGKMNKKNKREGWDGNVRIGWNIVVRSCPFDVQGCNPSHGSKDGVGRSSDVKGHAGGRKERSSPRHSCTDGATPRPVPLDAYRVCIRLTNVRGCEVARGGRDVVLAFPSPPCSIPFRPSNPSPASPLLSPRTRSWGIIQSKTTIAHSTPSGDRTRDHKVKSLALYR